MDKFFNIVLIEPEIPQNTGNIGRTCVGTNCTLHLVGKLGFEISDRTLKRAGLDYWQHLTWTHHESYDAWWSLVPDKSRVFYLSTKAKNTLYDAELKQGDWLVFGKETKGLDPEILREYPEQTFKLPMFGPARSLNLATAVAICAYEGIRQLGAASTAK